MSLLDFIPASVKHILDGGVLSTILGAFLGFFTLSNISTALGIVWLGIRISETERFKQFVDFVRRKLARK